ncbi:MAG: hypothetical protein ACYC6F_02815 [Longimicrobiales bacterium]
MAAGFEVVGLTRQGPYSELRCNRETILGAEISVLLALSHGEAFSQADVEDLLRTATTQARSLVLVAGTRTPGVLSYEDLFDAVGGVVPSWRALADTYPQALEAASKNSLPEGEVGEAWLVFERLVADGLEFVFGRRTRHLGGIRRGAAVPDVIAQLPSHTLIVVDAKASKNAYDAALTNLRALGEYLELVQARQTGGYGVCSALVVAPAFEQDPERLTQIALEFGARYGRPVSFLRANALGFIVKQLSDRPVIRNALRWPHLLRGGLVSTDDFLQEVAALTTERVGDE